MDERFERLREAVVTGDAPGVTAGMEAALAAGAAPGVLLEHMIGAMREVGRLFECGEYFPPEMLLAARAMQAGLRLLQPHLLTANVEPAGTVVIGTVKGDLHDIGKNLVSLMLEGAGFQIRDLGTDVSPEKFVAAAQAEGVDVVALSALLTTTMPHMQTTLEALRRAGMGGRVKVIIGGAPVTQDYADRIGADGFAPDAARAVSLVQALLQVSHGAPNAGP